jgi:hypothetical protein
VSVVDPRVSNGAWVRQRLSDRPTFRLFGAGIGVVATVAVLAAIIWWVGNGFLAGDTLTYWFAGHRLNIGHDLYLLRADDPRLFDTGPYGLFSPPLIAVPWMFLAQLPGNVGMLLWWVAMALWATWMTAFLLLGTRGWAGLAILPLVPSVMAVVGVGNVDAAMVAGIFVAWMLRDRPRALGILIAVLASVKLTPAVLVVWLIATRRWRALTWCAGAGAALAFVTMAVLGPGIFADYLGVMTGVSRGNPLPLVIVAAGLAAVLLLGRHETLGFALAVALIPFGSPVTSGHTWVLLLGALAPTINPVVARGSRAIRA